MALPRRMDERVKIPYLSNPTKPKQYCERKKGKITMKKFFALLIAVMMLLSAASFSFAEEKTYKIGICNYVSDASLNQIVENIEAQLADITAETGVKFEVMYDNCEANSATLQLIVSKFIGAGVDLMIGVATPVAIVMQGATEDNQIPVVFAAVSDPMGCGLVESLEAPGANVTGTSDYLDTNAVMNLIFAANPEADMVALLYDVGQDSSAAAIADAKAYLTAKGVQYKEYTGTNPSEILQAAQAIAADQCDTVFTPSDNTVMNAELSIYEVLAEAGIPHYTGADSFALNGAFLGYGVDYANLGRCTADLAAEILVEGKNPAEVPVMTFDNGTATINTEICAELGIDFDTVSAAFAPFCTAIKTIVTAESFGDVQ